MIKENELKEVKPLYDEWVSSISIPSYAKRCYFDYKCANSNLPFVAWSYYVFVENCNVHFVTAEPNLYNYHEYDKKPQVIKLSIDKIEYFSIEGEVYREHKISGGGGGGSSISGAIVGGLVAGGAGAVIGSRKEINEIKSELITHDTRRTFIDYYESDGSLATLYFTYASYKSFNNLFPEKEYKIVSAVLVEKIAKNRIDENDVVSKINKLNSLKNQNLITEEEYIFKREHILNTL